MARKTNIKIFRLAPGVFLITRRDFSFITDKTKDMPQRYIARGRTINYPLKFSNYEN